MRALAAAGDRGGALRHAEIFEALLAEELGVPADREVIALAETIRRDLAATPASDPAPPAPRATSTTERAIAVLPFAILGPNRTTESDRPWCDELADEMITALLEVPDLHVVARSASFALGPNPGLAALRGELAASHAIEGSVRRTPTGVRVNVRLIDASEGRAIVWERFDCAADEADAMPERIAAQFTNRLHKVLTG